MADVLDATIPERFRPSNLLEPVDLAIDLDHRLISGVKQPEVEQALRMSGAPWREDMYGRRYDLGEGITVLSEVSPKWGPSWWINWSCPIVDCGAIGWHLLPEGKRRRLTSSGCNPSSDLVAVRERVARHQREWHAKAVHGADACCEQLTLDFSVPSGRFDSRYEAGVEDVAAL